jgi:hypothetical protein
MIENVPDQSRSAAARARVLLEQKQPAEAARLLEQSLREHPGGASDHMLLGIALAQSGEWLMAVQHLEEAVAQEPGNAAAHHNLGLVYRQGGRDRDALAAFERALARRPAYPAAAQAAAEVRRKLAGATAGERAPLAGATGASPAPGAPMTRWEEPVEEGSVGQRLLTAMGQLLFSPGAALGGGLDRFFGTPGAIGAVVGLYVVSLVVMGVVAWLSPAPEPGEAAAGALLLAITPLAIVAGILTVAASAATVALYNVVTGSSQGFLAEFGSIALSLALVSATFSFVTAPIGLILALAGATGGIVILSIVTGIWALGLEVAIVEGATEMSWAPALVLLIAANFVGNIAAGLVLALLALAL